MTVKELIKKLQEFGEETKIIISTASSHEEIEMVKEMKNCISIFTASFFLD